jgi:hypothetical protein
LKIIYLILLLKMRKLSVRKQRLREGQQLAEVNTAS